MADFFGFEIKRKGNEEPVRPSFVPNTDEDGSGVIQAGGHFGAYLDLDGDSNTAVIKQQSTLAADWLKIESDANNSNICVIQNDGGTTTSC